MPHAYDDAPDLAQTISGNSKKKYVFLDAPSIYASTSSGKRFISYFIIQQESKLQKRLHIVNLGEFVRFFHKKTGFLSFSEGNSYFFRFTVINHEMIVFSGSLFEINGYFYVIYLFYPKRKPVFYAFRFCAMV
ncbi:hypothetical protein [Paenibacillus sp. 22594]|uniref:hypothetical protein n=1 Tax=Paenibacillus sp. 22594 TaxID=3453947 RepID=UPI003F87D161